MISTLAWRGLWRRKRRTMITLASIALGVWLAITFIALATSSYAQMIEGSVKLGYGHLTVMPTDYLDVPSIKLRVRDAEALKKNARATPGIRHSLVRITGQGMFRSATKSVGGAFWGVDPADEDESVNVFVRSMVEGQMLQATDGRGVVIGSVMAEQLGLSVGKKLVYTAVDIDGEIVSELARVSGIYETGAREVDASIILLPIDTVRRALRYADGEATLVAMYAQDHRLSDQIQARLRPSSDAEVLTWKQTQSEMAGLIDIDRTMNYVFQLLLGVLVAAGVLNTILMSVLERRREFGVMMAVGMARTTLSRLVLVESLMLATLGSVIGLLVTAPWYLFLAEHGIDASAMYGDQSFDASGVVFEPVIRALLYPEHLAAILATVFVLTIVAGLYPAYRAGRVVPVSAIKEI